VTAFNVSGLASGIDTTSLITQLMTVAAGPQTALKNQLGNVQTQLSIYQTINTKMAAVKSAADALALASTWGATTATSSDPSIVANGSSNALAGTATTFSVTQVARAQTSTLAVADPTNAASTATGLDLTVAGVPTHLALTGSSATDVASAINSASLGIRASVINTGSGTVLQFSSTSTGAQNTFSISGLTDGTPNTLVSAQDASVTVGGTSPGAYTLTSNTNTFTDAIPGVTFTVSKVVSDATVSVAANATSISNATNALVTATNDALSTIGSATAQGAVLAGDPTLEGLTQKMLSVVSAGASGQSYSIAGVGLTSTGSLTFDANAFAASYAKDPSSVQSMVQNALATGYSSVGLNATDTTSGSLTQLINTDNTQITSLNKQISDWDSKLADQKTSLQAKYAAMEAALSKLQSQSSYLTQMFASQTGTTTTTK
jgi:flagellar hook-associated protein 2